MAKWLLHLNPVHYLKPGIGCLWSDVQSRQPLRQALDVICNITHAHWFVCLKPQIKRLYFSVLFASPSLNLRFACQVSKHYARFQISAAFGASAINANIALISIGVSCPGFHIMAYCFKFSYHSILVFRKFTNL